MDIDEPTQGIMKNERSKSTPTNTSQGPEQQEQNKWQIVEFAKRRNAQHKRASLKQTEEPGINVKIFNANIDKYLDTQTFKYCQSLH